MNWFAILLLLPAIGYWLYKWSTKGFDIFEKRGVPFRKPWPLIGNSWGMLKNQDGLQKLAIARYRRTKQYKIFGSFTFRDPVFIINDPELIKKLGVKDFESFTNHQRMFNADADPLFAGMLTVMKDQRWKNMRNTITPIFTGAKMRAMFTLMNECFQESITYLHDQLKGGKSFDMNMKECFTRLSNDLIATTAFGLKVNSFKDKDNEFFSIGQAISKTRFKQMLKFMLYSMSPKLFELLGIRIIDQDKTDYFMHLVVDAMKYREEHHIVRPDMINLLMDAKKESPHNWSEADIVAQCFIFFFAAFENNANLLCLTCHELMENPEVQSKLYDEVMDTFKNLNGKTLDYDAIQKMKYMEMVVSETLRKWPLMTLIDRECGKDYTLTDADGNFLCELKKGDRLFFEAAGIHWDPEYYENPEVFDPERFNDENKHKITPFNYLPFGVGPRICIGSRYALMQAKAMLYYLLKDFKLERSEQTCKSILDDVRGFTPEPRNGFWLKLVKRD